MAHESLLGEAQRALPRRQPAARLAVFAPSPILTVTIEAAPDRPDVHLHPGEQGFWVARGAANLGAEVVSTSTVRRWRRLRLWIVAWVTAGFSTPACTAGLVLAATPPN